MQSVWFLFFLFWDAPLFVYSASSPRGGAHSGRIPSNVQIYSKKDLKENPSYHRVVSSNQESNEVNPPGSSYLSNSADHVLVSDIKLPQTINDLPPQHKVLYQRALLKDYDYAQFGDQCNVFTVDELDEFIGVFEDSIESHEGESQDRTISPEEKAEQLQQLFNHSRAMCDFRNLLACHKHFLTCACAHPSMGVNREGLCGVNIGHACELSGRTLKKYGVLVTHEISPIKCLLENAECVMENQNNVLSGGISPIRKICKCRSGFWGATCSRRNGPVKLVPPMEHKHVGNSGKLDFLKIRKTEEPLSEEVEGGRHLWMNDIGATAREYFMHPEEIKENLLNMMNEREMYSPENRAEEAQKLVNKLELDADKEEMVVNELHLRKLATLEHGNPCDPKRQLILDNPPVSKDSNHRWTDPHPEDIKSWQLGLLQQKKPFCNVYKLLRCNEASKFCDCKSGLELETTEGGHKECKIPLGHNCDMDFEPILEFDPLKDRKRFSEMDPPNCVTNTECVDKPLFFQKKCWCSGLNSNCATRIDEEFSSEAIQSRSTLKRGDSCDPKLHQRLLNYRNEEDSGYEKRIMVFREILDNPEIRLCDIENYLNCSDTTRTCECWKQLLPSQLEDGDFDCVAMSMASCGRTFEYGKYMYDSDGAQLWQVEKAFQDRFLPGCVPGAKCAGGDDPEWAGRCVCHHPSETGETCDDKKSILATAFKASSIPQNDVEEKDLLHVYYDLNKQTVLMEQLMTSGLNDACDSSIGLTLDRIVKFWREVANSKVSNSDQQTMPHYIAATKWTKYLVSTVQVNSASLCNATVGLRCHRASGRCGCHRGARWIGDRCFLDPDEQCNPKLGADWMPTCMQGTKCLSTEQNDNGEYRCASCGEDDEDCENDSDSKKEEHDGDEELGDTWDVEDDVQVKKKDKSLDEPLKVDETVEEEEEGTRQIKSVSKRSLLNIKIDSPDGDDDDDSSDQVVKNYFLANYHEIESTEKTLLPQGTDTDTEETPTTESTTRKLHTISTTRKQHTKSTTRKHHTWRNTWKHHTMSTTMKHTHHKKTTSPRPSIDKLIDTSGTRLERRKLAGRGTRQDDAYLLLEIRRMLKEILMYRSIPLRGTCMIDDEESLTKVMEALPLNDLAHPPNTIPMAYVVLSKLYWKGVSFCNRKVFLKCTWDAVCSCAEGFGLVDEHGECRLKEHNYCSYEREPISGKTKIPVGNAYGVHSRVSSAQPPFLCRGGNSCIQVDFGLPVCAKDEKQASEKLGRIRSQKTESGSSWTRTRQHVYSLGISVAIRMIITWAIV